MKVDGFARWPLWIAASASIVLVGARPAAACSHPYPPPGPPYLAVPADGSADVPTNVVLTVDGGSCDPSRLALRDALGSPVALSVENMGTWGAAYEPTSSCHLRPTTPLSPGTTYDLVYSGSDGFIDAGVPVGVGSFTTGSAADDTAPESPVVTAVTVGPRHACGYEPPEACCVPVPLLTATIAVAPASEPRFYSLREGDTFVAVDLPSLEPGILACGQYPEFAYEAGPGRLPTWWMQGDLHELVLTSRDLAGHESPPVYVTLSGLCAVGDHGTGPLPPGGSSADGGGGCHVSRGGSPGSALVALAALLLLRGTRGRRRS